MDLLVEPRAAFLAIKMNPAWLVALAMVMALVVIGAQFRSAAYANVAAERFEQRRAAAPLIFDRLTPAQRVRLEKQTVAIGFALVVFRALVAVLALVVALVTLTAVLSGRVQIQHVWSIVANTAVVGVGLAALASGIIIMLRGPASFHQARDLYAALPSAAWLLPSGTTKLIRALSVLNPFTVWMVVLMGYGLQVALNLSRTRAYVSAVIAAIALVGAQLVI
jgi:Yip1 domain